MTISESSALSRRTLPRSTAVAGAAAATVTVVNARAASVQPVAAPALEVQAAAARGTSVRITDPGCTHELYLVLQTVPGGLASGFGDLNWDEFAGQGVGVTA